jgi:hypothetical protein
VVAPASITSVLEAGYPSRYLESSLVGTAGVVSACPGSIAGCSLIDSTNSSASFSRSLEGFFGSSDMADSSMAVACHARVDDLMVEREDGREITVAIAEPANLPRLLSAPRVTE